MKRKSIRDKLLKNFALFSLIPVILFCIVMLIYILTNVQEKRKEAISSNLEHQVFQLDKVLLQAYQIGQTVAEDETVNSELSKVFQDERERFGSEIRLNSQLLGISRYFDENIQVYIIGENNALYKNSPYSFADRNFKEEDWYKSTVEYGEPYWYELHSQSYFVKTADREFVSLGIPVTDNRTGHVLGCVMVEVKVFDILWNKEFKEEGSELYLFYPDMNIKIVDEQVQLYDDDRITLIQENGVAEHHQVVRQSPEILETTKLLKYWKRDFQENGFGTVSGYVTAYHQLNANDWILVFTMPKENYYQLLIIVVIISVLITGALILIGMYVSYRMARSITKPILTLKENVEKVQEGDFETAVICDSDDEIGELGEQFNVMVVEIRNLMDRIQAEYERQRHYELLLLQAQINPHFLYNTLDSLMWLIRMKNHSDAEKMLEALTRFFKTGLNKGQEIVAIKHEVLNVESYLTIQLMRYKKKLSFSTYLEEGIGNLAIPKLILQPLVENAIYHGIKGKETGGSILVDCRKKDGAVILLVEDNGLGMSDDRKRHIQRYLTEGIVEETDNYGITNVNERLKLFFGSNCTMKIESRESEGTRVTVEIREECMYVQGSNSR